ncbi:MAG: hypothetical protein ACKPB3_01115, partial [Bacteroidota bacterium]
MDIGKTNFIIKFAMKPKYHTSMLKSFRLKHLFFVVLLTNPLALSGQNYCQQKGTMPYTLWG